MIGVNKAFVYVIDQEKAKQFWTEKFGCSVLQDLTYEGGGRWLEVLLPDKSLTLVISPLMEGQPQPVAGDGLPASNLCFACEDLRATFEDLTGKGVEFVGEPVDQPWGAWSMFKDSEGTRFVLGERAKE